MILFNLRTSNLIFGSAAVIYVTTAIRLHPCIPSAWSSCGQRENLPHHYL